MLSFRSLTRCALAVRFRQTLLQRGLAHDRTLGRPGVLHAHVSQGVYAATELVSRSGGKKTGAGIRCLCMNHDASRQSDGDSDPIRVSDHGLQVDRFHAHLPVCIVDANALRIEVNLPSAWLSCRYAQSAFASPVYGCRRESRLRSTHTKYALHTALIRSSKPF